MICCTLIAALLGIFAWPIRRWAGTRVSPLAWRPGLPATLTPAVGFSLVARLRSFVFAAEGLRDLFRYEHNAWIHVGAATIVVILGALLRVTINDWRWLILSIALVWAAEAGNTAVEQLCDLVHPGRHPVVKRVKDLAAGAVLLCALSAMLIGAVTFLPYLHRLTPGLDAIH